VVDAEVITDAGMQGVRQLMEDEPFTDIESAILHAFYLIPIGMRASYESVYKLLNSLDFQVERFPDAMKRHHQEGTILHGFVDNNWTIKYYYLDRSAGKHMPKSCEKKLMRANQKNAIYQLNSKTY
jgi:hypothetical protein